MGFYDNFIKLCKRCNKTPTAVATDLGINRGTVSAWKNKGTEPNGSTVKKIANYFGVSTDFLLKGEEAVAYHTADPEVEVFECLDLIKDPAVRDILLKLKRATPGDLSRISNMVDILLGGGSFNG